jgi:DNA polymerase III subunit delta'
MSEKISVKRTARLLPWHEAAVEQLRLAWSAKRFPHALLLTGGDGLGKRDLAAWLTCAVLCERSEIELQCCGSCASCKLIAAGTHPDVIWVSPEEDKTQLSVDQIRAATERLTKTSFRQGYKVALVTPAHQMTVSAANSLLKTLEEPSSNTLLVLITSQPSGLPPTVRSRCQRIAVQRPAAETALEWLRSQAPAAANPALLEFAGGAPLRAVDYADGRFDALDEDMQGGLSALFSGRADVTQVAAAWAKDELIDRLTWLDLWLSSMARGAIAGNADLITFPARGAHLPSLPRTLNISSVYSMVDRVRALKAQLARTALQRELALESWLIALLQSLELKSTPRATAQA